MSDYFDAFRRSSAEAAGFYSEPAFMAGSKEVAVFIKHADVETFLAKLLATLKPLGYAYSKAINPGVRMVDDSTAMYSTLLGRYKADGREVQRVGVTYLLKKEASWKIYELFPTDRDKLISAN